MMGHDISGLEPPRGTANDRTPQHYRGREKLQPWDVIE